MKIQILLLFTLLTLPSLYTTAQNKVLGQDSLELTFYPISGIANIPSGNGSKITGSVWIDSLTFRIKLRFKDDDPESDMTFNKVDFIELFFVIPELNDSSNFYIRRGDELFLYKNTANFEKFKKEWKNPLIYSDISDKPLRYNQLIQEVNEDYKEVIQAKIDTENYNKFSLIRVPFGQTHIIFYPGLNKVVNGSSSGFIEKLFNSIHNYGFKTTNIESRIKYQVNYDSTGSSIQLNIPVDGLSYISTQSSKEIRFLINVTAFDSVDNTTSRLSSSLTGNQDVFSSYNKLLPNFKFIDSLTYSKILPVKFDSTITAIFFNTNDGWIPIEKYTGEINTTTSLTHWSAPNLNTVYFGIGKADHRNMVMDGKSFNIYTVSNFNNVNGSTDYVVSNDSLILKVDGFIRSVRLNSGEFGYVVFEEEYLFGECRDGIQPCGCCTFTNFFFLTKQNFNSGKTNKIRICSKANYYENNVDFYPEININLENEKENAFTFNNFKDNTFIMRFSNKRVVQIKVDEEKWRLIFIKNW